MCFARKKKQFIEKKSAAVFSLVHRSQRDSRYHDEGASKMVLIPVQTKHNQAFLHDQVSRLIPEDTLYAADKDLRHVDYEDSGDEEEKVGGGVMGECLECGGKGVGLVGESGLCKHCEGDCEEDEEEEEEEEEEDAMLRLLGDRVDEFGLPIDGYDYSKHMREISEDGVLFDAHGRMVKRSEDIMSRKVDGNLGLPDELLPSETEQERMLEAIALTDDNLDPEIKEALSGWGDFEELLDDFVVTAMQKPEGEVDDEAFDFDAHVAKLMKAASSSGTKGGRDPRGQKGPLVDDDDMVDIDDDAEYETGALKRGVRFAADDDGRSNASSVRRLEAPVRKQRLVDEQFHMVLNEYNDEEIGELDDEDMGGQVGVDEEFFLDMMDEYLEKRQNEKKIEQNSDDVDEEELKAVNKKILNTIIASDDLADYVPEYEEIDEEELYKLHSNIVSADTTAEGQEDNEEEEDDDDDDDDDDRVGHDSEYEDEEEVFGETEDNKTTFAKIPKNDPAAYWLRPALFAKKDEHDCQTIVSTYSNTDNHPSVIASVAGKSRSTVTKIKLSNKTGLPILEKDPMVSSPICEESESEGEEDEDADIVREITLAPTYRPKGETAEQKRERKAAVKAQRKEKRELKKDLKSSYKYETAKAKVTDSVAVDITARRGQAVFKY